MKQDDVELKPPKQGLLPQDTSSASGATLGVGVGESTHMERVQQEKQGVTVKGGKMSSTTSKSDSQTPTSSLLSTAAAPPSSADTAKLTGKAITLPGKKNEALAKSSVTGSEPSQKDKSSAPPSSSVASSANEKAKDSAATGDKPSKASIVPSIVPLSAGNAATASSKDLPKPTTSTPKTNSIGGGSNTASAGTAKSTTMNAIPATAVTAPSTVHKLNPSATTPVRTTPQSVANLPTAPSRPVIATSTTIAAPPRPATTTTTSIGVHSAPVQHPHPEEAVKNMVKHIFTLLETRGPLTMGQLEYNLPVLILGTPVTGQQQQSCVRNSKSTPTNTNDAISPYKKLVAGNAVPDIVELLVALGLIQQENIHNIEPESTTSKLATSSTGTAKTLPPRPLQPRYAVSGGRPRQFIVTPTNVLSEIVKAQSEVEASHKRQELLRQALDSSTSDKRAAQLLEQIAIQYPQAVADDPVYVTALRNMHVDVVSVLGKRSHAILGPGGSAAGGGGHDRPAGSSSGLGGEALARKKGGNGTGMKTDIGKRARDNAGGTVKQKRKRTKKMAVTASAEGTGETEKPTPATKPTPSASSAVTVPNPTTMTAVPKTMTKLPKKITSTLSTPVPPTAMTAAAPGPASTLKPTTSSSSRPPSNISNPKVSAPEVTVIPEKTEVTPSITLNSSTAPAASTENKKRRMDPKGKEIS